MVDLKVLFAFVCLKQLDLCEKFELVVG